MTYQVVKFHTSKGLGDCCYEVAFNGDERCLQKLEVHSTVDFGSDALDYVELFGIWYFLMSIEIAGQGRSAKNLKLIVSRGAIKRLLRESSSKAHLFSFTNALRTQFFGLNDIEVDKTSAWAANVCTSACVRWDGLPPDYPEIENPVLGHVRVTHHAVERYYEATNREGRADQVFQRVCRILREADQEALLPAHVVQHKSRTYAHANDATRYLNTQSGWQGVILFPANEKPLLATVYQRSG
ncbi:hypothetical protein [Pseudomonas sp. S9]|uniref:hypothetical protein n=1 Tax=Pseudomonas sp. S9 TaxID=686578 RepID=UPI0002557657|nr:hypothetical protein [Pseudomonas sp. S9]